MRQMTKGEHPKPENQTGHHSHISPQLTKSTSSPPPHPLQKQKITKRTHLPKSKLPVNTGDFCLCHITAKKNEPILSRGSFSEGGLSCRSRIRPAIRSHPYSSRHREPQIGLLFTHQGPSITTRNR
jgi:hypothetical protein